MEGTLPVHTSRSPRSPIARTSAPARPATAGARAAAAPRAAALLAATAAAAAAGCVWPAEDVATGAEPAEPRLAAATSALHCSIFVCGDNAATAGDGLIFDELDLFGAPNHAGVRLVSATVDTSTGRRPATLWIDGDELRAYDHTGQVYAGGGLKGTIVKLEYAQAGSTEAFELLIAEVHQSVIHYIAGDPEAVPIYRIKSRRPARGQKTFDFHVCNDDVLPVDPTWAGYGHFALVYRGDRYDPVKTRVVNNDPNAGWSFLACAGSGAAKMHLYRHTHAGGFDDAAQPRFMTTLAQRSALMKAITARYCEAAAGPFTVRGNPIALDASAPFAMPAVSFAIASTAPPPGAPPPPEGWGVRSHEAIWTAAGAVCLDEPRRAVPLAGAPTWTRSAVEAACGRAFRTCTDLQSKWRTAGYALTANPW
jgi:hypothetical protein